MKELIFKNDKYRMNWLRDDAEYAKVTCPDELSYTTEHIQNGGTVTTKITLTNTSGKPYFTNAGSIGIYFPLQDKYDSSDICMKERCHTHLFCGGNTAWIMALRMGTEAPHLGIYFTKGSICGYSIERDFSKMSNDRGIFILHPSPMSLNSGESTVIEWDIFPHEGKTDFQNKLKQYSNYLEVSADKYVLFDGETANIQINAHCDINSIFINGSEHTAKNGCVSFKFTPSETGEHKFKISAGSRQTQLRLLVMPELGELAYKRCNFIAEKQQYSGRHKNLQGAYLIYDNEEQHMFYNRENDFNAGRERVGMAILLARYLRSSKNSRLEDSLKKYTGFTLRELVQADTGEVFNDAGKDNSYIRLYNYPWFALLFIELYHLWEDKSYLSIAVNIIKKHYAGGGDIHYSIEMPVLMLTKALKEAGMNKEYEETKALFIRHADKILEIGTSYPASEVNYEQSIVAPAADILFQVYLLTKDKKYFDGGYRQMQVLELFNGIQPDYHLHEAAIRHWDGYWFGKRRMYGDTFPHYWSALTANVYLLYAVCTKNEEYMKKAQDCYRGVLSMFGADGSASCAYVYPYSINGVRADYKDEYANDQDWGLYLILRYNNYLNNYQNISSDTYYI